MPLSAATCLVQTGSLLLNTLPFPLATIDFEASSLDDDGYPIEVGVAFWPAPDEVVFGWSALIRPAGVWTRKGHWSAASAKVHGIRGSDLLAHGLDPVPVAAALNAVLGPDGIAWCDGGPYDAHWAGALFKAAGVGPAFALGDWHRLPPLLGPAGRDRALAHRVTPSRHRARDDAERLLFALAHGAGVEAGPVRDLAERVPALAALAVPAL